MNPFKSLKDNQDGSIILIAIIVLALMTIIGISSSNQTVVESYIVRNVGIYKENLRLVEAAAMEALQQVVEEKDMDHFDSGTGTWPPMNLDTSAPVAEGRPTWFINRVDWEAANNDGLWYDDDKATPLLTAGNSKVPEVVKSGDIGLLDRRSEFDPDNPDDAAIRYAFVGWNGAAGSSEKTTGNTRKQGRILTEYRSENFGLLRLEVGVEKRF